MLKMNMENCKEDTMCLHVCVGLQVCDFIRALEKAEALIDKLASEQTDVRRLLSTLVQGTTCNAIFWFASDVVYV